MPQAAQTYSHDTTRMPLALRLVSNTLTIPAALARSVQRKRQRAEVLSVQRLSTEHLADRIALTVLTGHPDKKALAGPLNSAILEWSARDWPALGQRLGKLDRRRAALPSGARIAPAIAIELFRHIAGPETCRKLDRGQSVNEAELPDALFEPLLDCIVLAEPDPALHFLAAQLYLELGWARHGSDQTQDLTPDRLDAARTCFDTAHQILEEIAPQAPHSAYFAEVNYRVRAAEGSTMEDLFSLFTRWRRSDPTTLTPFAVHGLNMLPRWYGEADSVSSFANIAWAKTHEKMGAAAYAATYLSAMEVDPQIMLGMDVPAFREGLMDMMQHSDDPDVTCNAILRILWEVSADAHGLTGREATSLRRARCELRELFFYLVRHALGPVMPDVWAGRWTEAKILHAVAEAFEADIQAGHRVSIGLDGAKVLTI